MKKVSCVLFVMFAWALAGCATYKYELAQNGYGGGFVVRRYGVIISEYTVDDQGNAPTDYVRAKRRFIRRKATVDSLYKQMGMMYNVFLTETSDMAKMMTGFARLPGAAMEDRKYETNKTYRAHVDELQRQEATAAFAKRQKLRGVLGEYIKRDMEIERALQEATAKTKQ